LFHDGFWFIVKRGFFIDIAMVAKYALQSKDVREKEDETGTREKHSRHGAVSS